jgi:hypothetical protein
MLRKWWKFAAIVLIGAIVLGVWQFRISWVVTADGELQWTGQSTPPSREVVWTGAQQIESLLPKAESSTQMISPRLANQGATLYFTLRQDGGQSDLYVAERDDDGWKSARPIDVLNTDANELGPALSADEQTIWFYSNREGGEGGYDLYFAARDGAGWSDPQNAGPEINSVASEYDPALSSDGQTLFFASNRTDEMQAEVKTAQAENAPWETTLRARLSRAKFDLFRAVRDADEKWQTAAPVATLNRPRSNEGAPFVSPNGAYLYFASDRPARTGEDTNLDVYRSRLVAGSPGQPENLGPTINSEHHETEPALSAEGFTLIFSSDRDGVDRLYRSQAQEVFHRTGWAIPAVPQWLTTAWLTALALTLVIAAIFGALMHWRGLWGEKAYRARFMLSSLGLHMCLMALLAWWTLPTVIEVIMTELQEAGPAMNEFEDTGDTENPDPREAYEKVQDLAPVQDAAPMQPVDRQSIAQQQPQPSEPIDNPLPDLPQNVTHAVNPARVAYVPREQPPKPVERPELEREMTPLLTELVLIEELPELTPVDAPTPDQPAPQPTPVDVARQDTAPKRPDLPQRLPPTQVMKLAASVAELAEPKFEETPTVDIQATKPQPQRNPTTVQLAQADLPELPDLPNLEAAPETPTQTVAAATDLNRAAATAPNVNSPMRTESVAKLPGLTGPQPTTSNVQIASISPQAIPRTTPQTRPQFERTLPEPIDVAGLAVSEENLSPEITPTATTGMLVAVDATVARNTPVSPKAGSPQSAVLDSPAASQPASALSVAAAQQPTEIEIRTPAERIQRRGPAAPLLVEVADAALAALEATESLDGQLAMLTQTKVDVDRQSEAVQPSRLRNPLKRTTNPIPELMVTSLDATQRPSVNDLEFDIDRPVNLPVQRTRQQVAEVALAAPVEDIDLAEAAATPSTDVTTGTPTNVQVTRAEIVKVGSTSRPVLLARSNLAARSLEIELAEPTDDPLITDAPALQAQRATAQAAELAESEMDPTLTALAETDAEAGRLTSIEQTAVAVNRQQQPMKTTVDRTPMNESVKAKPQLKVTAAAAETQSSIRETEFAIDRAINESVTRTSDRSFEIAAAALAEATLADPLLATDPTMEDEASENAALTRTERPTVDGISLPAALARSSVTARSVDVVVATTGSLNDLLPDPTVPSDGLTRHALHPMTLAASQDTVELRSMFTLRKAENRRNLIDLLGGTPQSEQAVSRGLDWLAKVQEEDGSWDLKKHQGATKSNTAGTGFGLLPFLAAGHTHDKPGKYQAVVQKSIDWLLTHQQDTGDLMAKGEATGHHMYVHGIAAIALCEAFGVSGDDKLREPAQKALNFIAKAQHSGGGWRYKPGEAGDTSVVGWQMMALKSGEMAGLQVPTATYAGVDKWFRSVESKPDSGRFAYTGRGANLAMTAEGLLCLQFLGSSRNDVRMRNGADWLLKELPEQQQKRTSYYWYYATQVMYHMQGEYWETWNNQMRDMLVKTQKQSGATGGSWDPRDNWEQKGGRIMATSLKLLMLEVYYRHLPLYDQLDD